MGSMGNFKIFIIEDDPFYGQMLEYHLSLNPEYDISRFTRGAECLAKMGQRPDLITVDFSLPDYNGDVLYKKIKSVNDQVPVIMISGQEEVDVALKMLKMGVADYLVKDATTQDLLWNSIIKLREKLPPKEIVAILPSDVSKSFCFEKNIKGQSASLNKVFILMEKAAQTNINVSISGETGTGKEVVAQSIHNNGTRKRKPFIAVNMAAIPKDLIESELFGHEKGAFTGAAMKKTGKFEAANGGTIFLDEIAELDPSLQSKILRVLQEREITRVGGHEKIKLEVRLIVATHKDLAEEVKKGNFREDLYYRIMGLPIDLPPLRERGNDIFILAKYFVEEFVKSNGLGYISITQAAKKKLMSYHYPGNIRELKSVTELAVVMSDGCEIKAADIVLSSVKNEPTLIQKDKTLRQYNREIIQYFLKKYDDDVVSVADKLDIGKSTIYKMIQQKEIVLK
jgi:DNA-binding NtrC family response regulator